MTQEFVSKEVEMSDRLAQQIAVANAQEKLVYAEVGRDHDLREEGLQDMRTAREMKVRMTEESFLRVKKVFLKNDPIGSHVAGIASYEECQASIKEDPERLRDYERKMFYDGYSLPQIIAAVRESFETNMPLPTASSE